MSMRIENFLAQEIEAYLNIRSTDEKKSAEEQERN